MDTPNKVIDTIRKLLALAGNSAATPAEAATAAAKAQALLARYNLDAARIADTAEQGAAYIRHDTTVPGSAVSARLWKVSLATTIAKYNFCDVIGEGSWKRAIFIGKRHNLQVCEYLWIYLTREIERLAASEWRQLPAASKRRQVFNRTTWRYEWRAVRADAWTRAFAYGAINEIGCRLADEQRTFTADPSARALVTITGTELREAVAARFGDNLRTTSSRITNDDAFGAGIAAGHGIAINPGMSAGRSNPHGAALLG